MLDIDIGEELYHLLLPLDISEHTLSLSELASKYIIHKDKKPASWENHGYLIEPMNDMHNRIVTRKSAQLGVTTMHSWKALTLAKRYSSRIAIQISFLSASESEKYSQTRFAPIVNDSSAIARLVQYTNQSTTQKQVFQSRVKVINGCPIYFQGRSGEKQAISYDTNVVFVDESDFDRNEKIIAMLEGRVGHDFVFRTETTKGIIEYYSTPSMPGFGIDKMYQDSDQRQYIITCTRCNHEYLNEFDEKCIEGFYYKGEASKASEIYWRCSKCKRRLDITEVGTWYPSEPLKVRNCKWVAVKPENAIGSKGIHGYSINKPNCCFQWISPEELLNLRDSEIYRKYESKFFNQELGLPHMGSNVTVSLDVLEKNIKPPDIVNWQRSTANTIIGCDQGCWLVVAKEIYGSKSESFPEGRYGIVHIEHIHEDLAFDTVMDRDSSKEGLLSQRIREFGAKLVIIDDQPNSAVTRRLAQKFMVSSFKQYGTKIWRLVSSKINQEKTWNFDEQDYEISENRTKSLDETYSWISNMEVLWPQKGKLYQEIDTKFYKKEMWDMLDLLFDHICKETKFSKMPDHISEEHAMSVMKGSRSLGNYLTIGDKQNHLLHALKMVRTGVEILKVLGSPKIILPYMPAKEFFMKG